MQPAATESDELKWFLLTLRQALLFLVDQIERKYGLDSPRYRRRQERRQQPR